MTSQTSDLWVSVVGDAADIDQWIDRLPSSLVPRERFAAALVTSSINGSAFHVRTLQRQLRDLGVEAWVIDALARAPKWPVVDDDRLAAIGMFAAQLTTNPKSATERDVILLRDAGLSDVDVLDLTNVVGYYNYVNRVAVGVGLR